MDNINLKVFSDENNELTVRTGKAPDPLPLREPKPIEFVGKLGATSEYISRKKETIPVIESSILVDYDRGMVQLTTNENEYYRRIVCGKLQTSEDLNVFEINTGKRYSTFDLANLIRMHRYFFTSKETAMALVTKLKSFKAKVSKDLEKADDGQGNAKYLKDQIVDHNIPASFQLTMEVYKRRPPVSFMVDVIVDSDSLDVSLESPQLGEHLRKIKEEALEDEIRKIIDILPDIAVLAK